MNTEALTERGVRLNGSRLARALLRLAGWRIRFDGLPARQGVVIVYPHTSNWDFVVGVLAKWAVGIQVTFWGKASLFRVPLLGRWMRWLGGLPVDRDAAQGRVGQMVGELVAAREAGRFLWLALSPEGTRRYRPDWRSGFYHVARGADVPLALAYFDYRAREIGLQHFIRLSGDLAADMAAIADYLGQRVGHTPQRAAAIRLEA